MTNSVDTSGDKAGEVPGSAPVNETSEQKAERERRDLEKRRKELEERLEREKYQRDDM